MIVVKIKNKLAKDIEGQLTEKDQTEELDDYKLLTRYPARTFLREGYLTSQVLLPARQRWLGILLSVINGLLTHSMIFYYDYQQQDDQGKICWMDIILLVRNFGQRYRTRIQLNLIIYMVTYCLLGALYLCYFFGVNVTLFDDKQWVLIIYEIIIMLILTVLLLNYAVRTNAFKTPKQCKKELLVTIKTIESVKERLEKEQEVNPIKILGIPMRSNVLYTVYTGLISLAVAMIQKKTNFFN
ncbi:UNKNOWN [Stylonychia lemnae]|uniref:Uncharacterized protein n=1 Tax=Stylonychia lemnae TaxID=5949 RepID=A0A077ZMS0_STYLE|nr:UNKNOWN [Stylonychia lemnae]|eukprot:CDW71262.1 UNKNOWN [Stylonychia lemnae]